MKPLGPYSRTTSFAGLDGRSSDAQAIRRVRLELTAHVGGDPSPTQRILIERAAILRHQITLMDARQAARDWSDRDSRQYLAWVNALTRLMRHLGLEARPKAPPTLAELRAAHAPAQRAA